VRGLINGWTSSETTGSSADDTVAGKFATALFDESSRDTLLHVAVLKRYADLVRYLISQGARMLARNAKQMTPLSLVKRLASNLAVWKDCPLAVRLDGHPEASVNGVYTQRGEYGGFPRYCNEHGVHLWHRLQAGAWLLWQGEFMPDSDLCLGGIKGADEVPIAAGGLEWTMVVKGKKEKMLLSTLPLSPAGLQEELRERVRREQREPEAQVKEKRAQAQLRPPRMMGQQPIAAVQQRQRRGGRRRHQMSDVPQVVAASRETVASGMVAVAAPRYEGLNAVQRAAVHSKASAQVEALLLALRPNFAKFSAATHWNNNNLNFPQPWPKPDSAWVIALPTPHVLYSSATFGEANTGLLPHFSMRRCPVAGWGATRRRTVSCLGSLRSNQHRSSPAS
jgi:hypothetical protein